MSFFSDIFNPQSDINKPWTDLLFGKPADIITKPVTDQSKLDVANPLSKYLTSQIGQGVPRYNAPILTDLPNGGGASVKDYLNLTYDDVRNNAVASFKNNYSDLLENSAGALSSSSRAYNDNTALTNLELGLFDKRSQLASTQFSLASGIKEQNDKEALAQYQDWYKSLPQYNPILDKALSFLNDNTSSGTNILSGLFGGSQGILGDLLKAFAQGAAAGA